ncbi:hypothetical protein NQ318_006841 [Aromia moschata]|uniref:Aspartyl/asparaginy/proline hydroxylase domain-containing protein n=1 Tax=Aromia moschata TaxID=1265417 RepID=A0AAV8YL25_9CUCU|nr:hypothetical protein NQ318_006841 [Aromia moschata]
MQVYEKGVANKVFLSKYQRSLYNVPRLTGKPWWEIEELPYLDMYRILRQNWQKIRDEGLAVLNLKGYFQDESENLKNTGDWKQFELFARGHKNTRNCDGALSPAASSREYRRPGSCKKGTNEIQRDTLGDSCVASLWAHTNCRLRVHLGLKVPLRTYIRVSEEIRAGKKEKYLCSTMASVTRSVA